MEEHGDLYARHDLPGAPILSNTQHTLRADHQKLDEKLWRVAKKSTNGQTGGTTSYKDKDRGPQRVAAWHGEEGDGHHGGQ